MNEASNVKTIPAVALDRMVELLAKWEKQACENQKVSDEITPTFYLAKEIWRTRSIQILACRQELNDILMQSNDQINKYETRNG